MAAPVLPSWRCRRKWRNGSLGFVHWASQYGYEHRRHEGEQIMNISNSTTFVFHLETSPLSTHQDYEHQCVICGLRCQDDEALSRHLALPALPLSSAQNYTCEKCSKVFLSDRALQQHVLSCGPKPANQTERVKSNGYSEAGRGTLVSADVVVDSEGERLLHFARQTESLRKHLPTKASAKRAIEIGELLLNGETVEDSRKIRCGDIVQLRLNKERETQESTVARAKSVILVTLNHEGQVLVADSCTQDAGPVPWNVIRSLCPEGVAIVWKPSGMRSLGGHAGTLQTSLKLMPELQLARLSPTPLSRLEIGCSGLSLVALNEFARCELNEQLHAGCVTHIFKALLHGRAGAVGEVKMLNWKASTSKTERQECQEELGFEEQGGTSALSEGTEGIEDGRLPPSSSESPSQVSLCVVPASLMKISVFSKICRFSGRTHVYIKYD